MPGVTTEVKISTSMADLETEYGLIETQIKGLEDLRAGVRDVILKKMEAVYGHAGVTYENPETGGKLQRILNSRRDADAAKVKAILGAALWEKVKKEMVDLVKLDAIVTAGLIDGNELHPAVNVKEIDQLKWSKD